jgi:hypothetical protein
LTNEGGKYSVLKKEVNCGKKILQSEAKERLRRRRVGRSEKNVLGSLDIFLQSI